MNRLRNLPVGVRIGGAFAILLSALAIVAIVAVASVRSLQGDAHTVAERDVKALHSLAMVEGALQTSSRLLVDHLYVYDGDLATQDLVADKIEAANGLVAAQLLKLQRGVTSAEGRSAYSAFAVARGSYNTALLNAVALSRDETIEKVEERVGSRTVHTETLMPAIEDLTEKLGVLDEAIQAQAEAQSASVDATASTGTIAILIAALVAALLAILSGVFITRSVTGPLGRLLKAAGHAADGDLRARADIGTRDQIGRVGDAFDAMATSTGALVGKIQAASQGLAVSAQQLAAISEQTGRVVNEVARAVGEVAAGAQQQTTLLGDARDATDGVARAVRDSAQEAVETSAVAAEAQNAVRDGVSAADDAGRAMDAMRESSGEVKAVIDELGDHSKRISGIVESITTIAQQTNLLALNAAIEAARAGEHGRGFAVVAEEVRTLAEESRTAAETISGLVTEIQQSTGRAISAVDAGGARIAESTAVVDQAREAFLTIGTAVEAIGARIDGIAGGAKRVAEDADRVNGDMGSVALVAEQSSAAAEEVSASTQETSASTEEIAASAQELARTAEDLRALTAGFTV